MGIKLLFIVLGVIYPTLVSYVYPTISYSLSILNVGFLHCYDWTEDNRYYYLLTNYYAKATPLEKTIKTFRDWFTSEEEKRRKRGVGGGFEDFCVRLIITLSERITTLHELGFCVDGLNMDAVSGILPHT